MANGSTYLRKQLANSNQKKWTLSVWVKRGDVGNGSTHKIFGSGSGSYEAEIAFNSNDKFSFYAWNGGSYAARIQSNAVYKDQNAWYHVVMRWDTANATAGERMRAYINGVELTDLQTNTVPSQNTNSEFNANSQHEIGAGGSANGIFSGCMSHMHFCDGQSYAPTEFGQTDSTTGEWKIKTDVSVTYGTQGFFIFEDGTNLSGSTVQDQSGQGNDWTVQAGTLTKTQDNPSNSYATLSPYMIPRNSGGTISNANLFFGTSSAQWTSESSSFGISKGKYYFEVKLKDNGNDRRFRWGLQKQTEINGTGNNKVLGGTDNNAIGYKTNGESSSQGGYFINQSNTDLTDGDINADNAIYGFAIDLDNQKMYGHFNGTWLHSGNPSAGSGGIDVSSFYTVGEPLFPSFTVHTSNIELNFGNGYFGTTAVATNSGSGYQDVDGNGIFNYTVPTNFRALCTKGINQ